MPQIALSRRLRQTPFSDRVEAAGVSAYTVYNRMLLPAAFCGLEQDYRHLKTKVQVWDVAVERQVALVGDDASRLMQMITPRDLSRMKDDQCFYVPVVDDKGGMLNDPVAIKHDANHWWISIADSDLLYWVKGLAVGLGLRVDVHEPDVSPLAVQGPLADDLVSRVFGPEAREIRFFRHKRLAFDGIPLTVARSGYSKQGGFEIYVEDGALGPRLWDALFEAGQDLGVQAGCPNLIERIEAGMLSYGNDMTRDDTPYHCGLGKFCNRFDGIGGPALRAIEEAGPTRQICPISISGAPLGSPKTAWALEGEHGRVGQVTSAAWSPDFTTTVAIGMVDQSSWTAGTELTVHTPEGPRTATVQERFWL